MLRALGLKSSFRSTAEPGLQGARFVWDAFKHATSGEFRGVPHRGFFERTFNADFRNVRAHLGTPEARRGLAQLGARAAAGIDGAPSIAFDEPQPPLGRIAHELTHVVQHARGRSRNALAHPFSAAEREATEVAAAALRGDRVRPYRPADGQVSLDCPRGRICPPRDYFDEAQLALLRRVGLPPEVLTPAQARRLSGHLGRVLDLIGRSVSRSESGPDYDIEETPTTRRITFEVPGEIQLHGLVDLSRRRIEIELRLYDPPYSYRADEPLPPQEFSVLTTEAPARRAEPANRPRMSVAEVRQALQERRWHVDSLTAQLTDGQMSHLSASLRLSLLRYIANGYRVGGEDEETLIRLLRTTPESQRTVVSRGLSAALLRTLESAIDNDNYIQYHTVLRPLLMSARTPEQLTRELGRAREFLWSDATLVDRIPGAVYTRYSDFRIEDDGLLHFRYHVYFSGAMTLGMGMELIPETEHRINPHEIVAVRFLVPDANSPAPVTERGQVAFMPAIGLMSLMQSQFRRELTTSLEAGLVLSSPAGVMGASTRLRRAIAALEAIAAATDLLVREGRRQIAQTDSGRRFLEVWDVVSTVISLYGMGRTLVELPDLFQNLRRMWELWRSSRGPGSFGAIDDEVQRLVEQADQVTDVSRPVSREGSRTPPGGGGRASGRPSEPVRDGDPLYVGRDGNRERVGTRHPGRAADPEHAPLELLPSEELVRSGRRRLLDPNHEPQGYAGIYDPDTGVIVVRPSVPEFDQGLHNIPPGWVSRGGGHEQVLNMYRGRGFSARNASGFTLVEWPYGGLEVRWNSQGVNGGALPFAHRPAIMAAVRRAFPGRRVFQQPSSMGPGGRPQRVSVVVR